MGAHAILDAISVIAVACTGKFCSSAGAALLVGFDWRRSVAVGVLMNSRGLTVLVVLQVGVSLGILSKLLASIMIIMAVVATIAATPPVPPCIRRPPGAGERHRERENGTEPNPARAMPAV